MPAETKLTEMVLPEGKVLEQLNAVSTAKRLANMVRHPSFSEPVLRTDVLLSVFERAPLTNYRSSTTPTSGSARRFTKSKTQNGRRMWKGRDAALDAILLCTLHIRQIISSACQLCPLRRMSAKFIHSQSSKIMARILRCLSYA